MTFMSRKISNDLENMGATAGYIGDKAKCELFFPFVSEARAIQDTRLKKRVKAYQSNVETSC